MLKFLNILSLVPSLSISLLGGILKLLNEGVKPITDETKTNKDNKIQEKTCGKIEKTIRVLGKVQTIINKFN
jgi:hypothetical protein